MIKRFRESILLVVLFVVVYQTMAEEFPRGCLVEGNPVVDSNSNLFIRGKDERLYEWLQNSKDGREFWQVYQLPSIGEQDIKSDPIIGLESYDVKVDETDETGNVILDEDGNPRKIEQSAGDIRQVLARGEGGHLLEWRRAYSGPLETDDWQGYDLTTENEHLIAGTPSKTSNWGGQLPYFYTQDILQRFFTTSTPDDHLLRWLLPKLVLENESSKDERVWSVVDLTSTDYTTQNSAGDISIDYLNNNIFTRDSLGHLIVGWPFLSQEGKIDLTAVVGGQTIIGNPIGYGTLAQTKTGSDIYQFFLHVFARDLNDHLYEWRHVWEGEPVSQAWRETLNTGWQLSNLTEKVGGNVAGNIAVYMIAERKEREVVTYFLNVLARNGDDHLLKWSKEHSAFTQENGEWIFRIKEDDCWQEGDDCWKFEDLTDLDGYFITGDPMIDTDFPRISSDISLSTEQIFVKGENNHLLRWSKQWQEKTREDENGTWTAIIEPGPDSWQITDLTRRCENASGTSLEEEDSQGSEGAPNDPQSRAYIAGAR